MTGRAAAAVALLVVLLAGTPATAGTPGITGSRGTAGAPAAAGTQDMAGTPATAVTALSASVSDGVLRIDGRAVFADQPVQVGEDVAGDAVPGVGADITAATIAAPVGGTRTLTFTLDIADQPPAQVGGVPETVLHWWEFTVDTAGGSQTFLLIGMRGGQVQTPGSVADNMRLMRCPDACYTIATVPGRIGGGAVRWSVPASAIGAAPGAWIWSTHAWTFTTAAGLTWGSPPLDVNGAATPAGYRVPGATVRFGVAPSGTPPSDVATEEAALLHGDGTFEGALDLSEHPPGDYVVVVRACYGTASCGTATTTVRR